MLWKPRPGDKFQISQGFTYQRNTKGCWIFSCPEGAVFVSPVQGTGKAIHLNLLPRALKARYQQRRWRAFSPYPLAAERAQKR